MLGQRKALILLFAAAVLLAACGAEPIARDLDQRRAMEIVAILNSNGIVARAVRETGARGQYNVEVRPNYYAEAVNLLYQENLLREQKISLRELVGQQGLMPPSRDIEVLRIDMALALELEGLLESDPRISHARVMVRQRSTRKEQDAAVTVMLQTLEAIPSEEIVQVVRQVIPGLEHQQVLVLAQPSTRRGERGLSKGVVNQKGVVQKIPLVPFLGYWHVPDGQYDSLAWAMAGLLFAAMLLGIGLGYGYAFLQLARRQPVRRVSQQQSLSGKESAGGRISEF